MKEEDAEESLETNKVEKHIRKAADAGAIVFSVLIDAKELHAKVFDPEECGIIIFSTSRRRNLRMLTEAGDNWVPLGIARYSAPVQHLQVVPRKRFEDSVLLYTTLIELSASQLEVLIEGVERKPQPNARVQEVVAPGSVRKPIRTTARIGWRRMPLRPSNACNNREVVNRANERARPAHP